MNGYQLASHNSHAAATAANGIYSTLSSPEITSHHRLASMIMKPINAISHAISALLFDVSYSNMESGSQAI